ncbi:hypothetical protein H5410_046782 [Solanum commersonii]|uniref:Uncharacterized protein n=1 Tax=Solanum commersonii TaxID=4109 RepID=A0A9J5XGG8_SOLCO|nr:hypothetical protein H5410_046782 [Solanum commersonii]
MIKEFWRKGSAHKLEQEFHVSVNIVPNIEDSPYNLRWKVGDLPIASLGMNMEWCSKKILTLVNSVLDALPSYMMSIFPILDKVTKMLDASRRNFYGNE